jgi:iron complex outermembrane receptor protein
LLLSYSAEPFAKGGEYYKNYSITRGLFMKIKATHLARHSMLGLLAITCLPVVAANQADTANTNNNEVVTLPDVTVTGAVVSPEALMKAKPPIVEKYKLPNTTESVTTEEIDERVNLLTVEDSIKYEPSIEVRKRYIGDTNEPLGTRTATTSQSARTMIFADGILLSTYLNNNNSNTGSPRWNTVAPNELERADMLYGPFSAQYAGNSMGGVLNLTTKIPKKFEAGADIQGSYGSYNIYGAKGNTNSENYSAFIGDKVNDLSFRFDFNHLDSLGQPIAFLTTLQSANSGSGGTPVTGAVASTNPYGKPIWVLGTNGGQYLTHQDNFKWKLAYDITPTLQASYTLGMWQNDQSSNYASYLRDAGNNAINSGNVIINGKTYNTISALGSGVFSPTVANQTTWSHGMALKSNTGGKFDWELIGSLVELGHDTSRFTTVSASINGPGRNTVLTGSNWNTADAKGIWRPGDYYGNHEVSFGFHNDYYQLVNPVYKTANWQSGDSTGVYSDSEGKTITQGYWVQDAWDFAKQWNFTAGGRLENWNAYDGLNTSTTISGLKTINQANQNSVNFSPKGKLTWNPNDSWRFGTAIAQSYRYPTAGELFQTTTTNNNVYNANPNLKPEEALSSEFSSEYFLPKGKLRLSFFQERVKNAIYSMSTFYGNNVVTANSNIGQTDSYGLEFSGEAKDVFIDTLNFYGSGTWTDATITANAATDAAAIKAATAGALQTNPGTAWPSTGAMLPRIPTYRSTFTVSYNPLKDLTTSLSGRYSSAAFGQLNNSDISHMTYTAISAYFVVDAKVSYKIDKQWTVNAGIDNLNNENYWIYHPFMQRTYTAQIKYNY